MYWDEDNRLMVLSYNGKTCRYTYNDADERIVKSHSDLEGVYINGAPQGISFHETEDYTIYYFASGYIAILMTPSFLFSKIS